MLVSEGVAGKQCYTRLRDKNKSHRQAVKK
jgi:hypothetical protein